MKKKCAKEALKYIKDKSIIGLGGGTTIGYLVSFIKESGLDVSVVTPSSNTERLCIENGIKVIPTWTIDYIDIAFDGCDEVDDNLNALKSGGGIHTKEKIIASMANDYILLVDESKVSHKLQFKYPVVLEIIPESLGIVKSNVEKLGGKVSIRTSDNKDGFTISDHGLFLLNAEFFVEDVTNISQLNDSLKMITGVVDTSLFCNLVTKVIIATPDDIRIIQREG